MEASLGTLRVVQGGPCQSKMQSRTNLKIGLQWIMETDDLYLLREGVSGRVRTQTTAHAVWAA